MIHLYGDVTSWVHYSAGWLALCPGALAIAGRLGPTNAQVWPRCCVSGQPRGSLGYEELAWLGGGAAQALQWLEARPMSRRLLSPGSNDRGVTILSGNHALCLKSSAIVYDVIWQAGHGQSSWIGLAASSRCRP